MEPNSLSLLNWENFKVNKNIFVVDFLKNVFEICRLKSKIYIRYIEATC